MGNNTNHPTIYWPTLDCGAALEETDCENWYSGLRRTYPLLRSVPKPDPRIRAFFVGNSPHHGKYRPTRHLVSAHRRGDICRTTNISASRSRKHRQTRKHDLAFVWMRNHSMHY